MFPVGTQGKCEWKQDELEDSDTSGEEEKENVDKQKQITRKRKVNILIARLCAIQNHKLCLMFRLLIK